MFKCVSSPTRLAQKGADWALKDWWLAPGPARVGFLEGETSKSPRNSVSLHGHCNCKFRSKPYVFCQHLGLIFGVQSSKSHLAFSSFRLAAWVCGDLVSCVLPHEMYLVYASPWCLCPSCFKVTAPHPISLNAQLQIVVNPVFKVVWGVKSNQTTCGTLHLFLQVDRVLLWLGVLWLGVLWLLDGIVGLPPLHEAHQWLACVLRNRLWFDWLEPKFE